VNRLAIELATGWLQRLVRAQPRKAGPAVAETAREAPGGEAPLTQAQHQALSELAAQVVKTAAALAGRNLSRSELEKAVERAVRRELMASPRLDPQLRARVVAQIPRIKALAVALAAAAEGLELSPAGAWTGAQLVVDPRSPMAEVLEQLKNVAATDLPVLLVGETGTGKELLARAVHSWSLRAKGPMIAINCAAIPLELAESELFGHTKGAFTGAASASPGLIRQAHGGTLFLDEVGLAPPELQAKLLRVLETGEVLPVGGGRAVKVDFRVVAATDTDLHQLAAEGRFNPALVYRLDVVRVVVPPLRERPQDLEPLIEYFLEQACLMAKRTRRLSPEVHKALKSYPWPGNVRELANVIQRMVATSTTYEITEADLPPEITAGGIGQGVLKRLKPLRLPSWYKPVLARVLATRAQVANRDLRDALGCSDSTAKNILRVLVAAGILKAVGARGGRRYELVEAREEEGDEQA